MKNTKKKALLIAGAILVACALVAVGVWIWQSMEEKPPVYTVADTLPDGNGQRATVILLGGQSNASGCSLVEYLEKNVTEEAYAEYTNGFDNVYINYLAGQNLSGGFVRCAAGQGELDGAFGPELGLAEYLHVNYPDETFFIVKCAWGGTNLFEQWLSPSAPGKTGDLYRHFVAFVTASLEYLSEKGYDVRVEAMCWMQGESDSFDPATAKGYGDNLTHLIGDVRTELTRYASDDGIALVDATIAQNPVFWVYCDDVNRSKREVAEKSPLNVLVDTSHLVTAEEPVEAPDLAHYDSMSEIELGQMFGAAAAAFFD